MKRIIAAALSVLVGAFGYTIVDSAIEDRVATLESEVIELREEVSGYHPKHTTSPYEGSIPYTTEEASGEQDNTTTETEDSTGIHVGDYLYESSNSIRKFLIREYSDGKYQYIPSHNYEPVSFGKKEILTEEVSFERTVANTNDYVVDLTTNDDVDDLMTTAAQTTQRHATNEYFVYLTDVTAQWTEIEVETSYSYSYDKDYSQVSQKHVTKKNYITVKYKGYTDSQLAGTKISFVMCGYRDDYSWKPISVTNNLIDENGYFEFEAIYCRDYYVDNFYIGSITIK